MRKSSLQILTWSLRLCSVAIILWWPALLRDPIYTPRQARLTGQAIHLPPSTPAELEDEHAFAIFWGWENRSLVSNRWAVGPYQGVRNPEGRWQTLLVLFIFWVSSSLLLWRWTARFSPASTWEQQDQGVMALLSTPLWQWIGRR
jgi:hypothetical protein